MSAPESNSAPPPSASASGDRLFIWTVLVGAAVVIGLAVFWPRAKADRAVIPPDRERRLGEFTLTERSGRSVSRDELKDQFLVVSFVFTSCATTCLRISDHMQIIQARTANDRDVRLLSLSVDPRTDTPKVLDSFARKFSADTNRWLFLTGDKATLYPLIETSFLPRDDGPLDPTDPTQMPGGFVDSFRIAVTDRAGKVRAYFNGLDPATPAAVVTFIETLRKE
jgi:cytochrome oxidase Cu insertion factor (SCO1/SenC/PrrC family)